MPKVNPSILRWARETAGLDVEEAAERIGLATGWRSSRPETVSPPARFS
ncbi:hypothetical protein HNR29_006410 [Rhizobium leguminosarum]|nr:hypothetical protein [Rhizobium leguminosarum]